MKSLFEILGALHSAGMRDEYLALRHYIDERDILLDQQKNTFCVLAGKYDDLGANCKYSANFSTLDEAIAIGICFGDNPPWQYFDTPEEQFEYDQARDMAFKSID